MFGYACFPILAMGIARLRSPSRTLLLIGASLAAFALLMIAGGHAMNNPSGSFGIIRMATCFAAGIGLCRLHQIRRGQDPAASLAWLSVLVIALCFCQARLGVLSVFGFAGLIYALAGQAGPIGSFMTTPVIMWLGRVSFSFYLVHSIPLELFHFLSGGILASHPSAIWPVFAVAVASPFYLAALTYRFIELPFQTLGRRLSAPTPAFGRASHAA